MSCTSHREIDTRCDMEFSEFLDSNFYEKSVITFFRHRDAKTQLKGIDVTASFKFDDGIVLDKIKIDEKIQSSYINKNLQTNAFELSFLDKKKRRKGWFLNQELETEYYLIVWPFSDRDWTRENLKFFKKETITLLDCMLIEKETILNFLDNEGYCADRLYWDVKSIIRQNKSGVTHIEGKPFRYYFSSHLAEMPVCLLIDKKILKELACKRFFVFPDKIRIIK